MGDSTVEDERSAELPSERFRWLLDATTMAIVGVGSTGRIIMTNRQADRLFGYAADELTGRPIEILVPDAVRGSHVAYRDRYLHDPRTRPMGHGLKLSARRRDGSEFPAEISLAALDTGDGVLIAATVHDITDRIAAEQERDRMQAELDRSRRLESIGRLAAGIAHDFNNTLGIMLGQVDLLTEDVAEAPFPGAEDTRAALTAGLTRIREAGQRAAQLTQGLLAFGQRQAVQAEPVALDQVATDAARMLTHTLGGHIQLETRLTVPDAKVLADRGKLEQVVINLAINARDAMPEGGTLTITTRTVDLEPPAGEAGGRPPGRYLCLEVTDTGTGIPPEIAERVFEPFFTTKAEGQGTGLGLATVHGTIQQAGGTVALHSRPGEGTTVTILLPELKAKEAAVQPAGPATRALAERRGDYRVLVVDDEPDLRELACLQLRRGGYQVLAATAGEHALDLIERTDVDVLLTDVSMPGMSGPQLADAARAVRPALPVVFMSGYARALVTADKNTDGTVFIEKPFTRAALLARLDGALGLAVEGR